MVVINWPRKKAKKKLNVRERISTLRGDGDLTEIDRLSGGGVDVFVCGFGRVDGRVVAIGAEDFTVAGGSIGISESSKRYRIAEMALQERIPMIMLLDGAGHRPITL
ncbi:MAG: carboxyl transferase domain-containing protein [Halieaceae bacterium]|nr:carboxyl transferase domain-containing protein [Halieaceae bacterium]